MTTAAVASRLAELCKAGEFIQAQKELYDANIKRIDPDGGVSEGKATMHQQEEKFLAGLDRIHNISVSEPQVAGSYFSVILMMEVDVKNVGHRKFEEVCVYRVLDGKIIFEQFFRG